MIRVKVKVKNDHRSLSEDFEASELFLSQDSEQIQDWVKQVIEAFNQPVDEVTIRTSMEI